MWKGNSLNARLKLAGLGILALLLVVVAVSTWMRTMRSTDQSFPEADDSLTGSLLLTYAIHDQATDNATLVPALFDFSSSEATYINIEQNGPTLTGIQHAWSPNGMWMTFVDSSPREIVDNGQSSWPGTVYRARLSSTDWPAMAKALAAATPVGSSTMAAFPDISDRGDILYMATSTTAVIQSGDTSRHEQAEDWRIVLVDAAGNERVVTEGTHPQWLDDEHFLFLKTLGIYEYSLSDGTETLVTSTLTPVVPTHRLVVDQRGARVLLIEPRAEAVRLFNVEPGEGTVVLREQSPIMAAAASAIFSPDGRYIALSLFPGDVLPGQTPLVVYDQNGRQVYQSTLPHSSWTFTSLQAWTR